MKLDDIFDTSGAVVYINRRLADRGEPGVALPTFKQHIFQEPWVQIEPIRLGNGDNVSSLVFTRRMLDAYVNVRERNRRPGLERIVVQPTAAEDAAIMDAEAAAVHVNGELYGALASDTCESWASCKVPWATAEQINKARAGGEIAGKTIGRTTAYLSDGLRPMIARKVRETREAELRMTDGYVLMRHCPATDEYIIVLDGRNGGDWVESESATNPDIRWIVLHESGRFLSVAGKRMARELAEDAAASDDPVAFIVSA